MSENWGASRFKILVEHMYTRMYSISVVQTYAYIYIYIYDPGSRFADPPPPPPMVSPPPPTLPKPNLCDCAHVFHMRAPKANCDEDRVPRRPIRVTVHIFHARLSREGAKAKAINCHEDRVSCDCRHFRKRTPT